MAETKAFQIELDIKSGRFDPTLRADKVQLPSRKQLLVVELFSKLIQYKAKRVAPDTLDKYRALLKCLKQSFGNCSSNEVDLNKAEKFMDWYSSQKLSQNVIKGSIPKVQKDR